MALREEQIVRYSRQILLRQVGGRGQEALLAGGVRLEASGAAGLTAAAYLAAGGTGVEVASPRVLGPGAPGFLVSAEEVGAEARAVLGRELPAFSPDALAARGTGRLMELPAAGWDGEGPWVALGGEGARGVVVYRGAGGCAACFEATTAGLGAPPEGALAVGLGALGALALQRLLLGLGPALGACAWSPTGGLEALSVRQCGQCD